MHRTDPYVLLQLGEHLRAFIPVFVYWCDLLVSFIILAASNFCIASPKYYVLLHAGKDKQKTSTKENVSPIEFFSKKSKKVLGLPEEAAQMAHTCSIVWRHLWHVYTAADECYTTLSWILNL